jgi:hypothetical protein
MYLKLLQKGGSIQFGSCVFQKSQSSLLGMPEYQQEMSTWDNLHKRRSPLGIHCPRFPLAVNVPDILNRQVIPYIYIYIGNESLNINPHCNLI